MRGWFNTLDRLFGSTLTARGIVLFGSTLTARGIVLFGSTLTARGIVLFGSTLTARGIVLFGSTLTARGIVLFGSTLTARGIVLFGSTLTARGIVLLCHSVLYCSFGLDAVKKMVVDQVSGAAIMLSPPCISPTAAAVCSCSVLLLAAIDCAISRNVHTTDNGQGSESKLLSRHAHTHVVMFSAYYYRITAVYY